MHGFSRRRWLLVLGLLLLLAVSVVLSSSKGTVAASGPAPAVQLIHLGELRAGLAGNHAGALSQLAVPATPIRVPAGTTLALEASAEAVFFQGTGVADFGLTLEDAGGRLLDYDDWEVAGTGPKREPGYLRVETPLDTSGEVELVLKSYANARLGGRQALDRQEIPLTVQVVDSTAALSPVIPAVKTLSEPASLAAEDEPVSQQTNVLAAPRVHVFGAVAAAEAFATTEMPALSVLQGQRTRVEVQPEVVWYAGAAPASVNSELKLFLIDSEGARVPYGEASATFSEDGPGIAGRPLWINLMLNDPGEFDLVAQVSTGGPSGAASQVEVPFRLIVEEAPAGQRAYIAGRVTGAETGAPIANVPVRARRADGTGPTSRIAHTDEHGRYLLEVLYGGEFVVQFGPAVREGYPVRYYPDAETPEEAEAVRVVAGRTVKGIDFAYEPLGSITGRVIAEETGEPVVRPFIVAGVPGSTRFTWKVPGFEDGTYVLGPLPPGQYWVGTAHTDTLRGEYYHDAATIEDADLVTVEARRQTTGIDFALAPQPEPPPQDEEHGIITGRVVDQNDGTPLSGIAVIASSQVGPNDWEGGTTETSGNGAYTLSVPPGAYTVLASDQRRRGIVEYYDHVLDRDQATAVLVRAGEVTDNINFTLPGWPEVSGAIEGRVYAAEQPGMHRQALMGRWLSLFAMPLDVGGNRVFRRWAEVDDAGYYRLDVLEPGRYRVWAEDQIFQRLTSDGIEVVVNDNATTAGADIEMYLVDGPHIGTLSGRITDEHTGQPLEGIQIYAYENGGAQLVYFATTDADGRYHFDRIAGNFFVQALDPNGQYVAEWWSDYTDSATNRTQAREVQIYRGADVTGIDLALQPISR